MKTSGSTGSPPTRCISNDPARCSCCPLSSGWRSSSPSPLAIVCAYSFLTRGDYGGVEHPWTLDNFTRLADPLYLAILWRSLWIAALSTAICALLGFPLALFIARAGRLRNLYLQLVLLPFWTSFLVRTYAWLFILRDTGLINTMLAGMHLIRTPLQLLYNDGAVLLGLVYNFLPFFVLPLRDARTSRPGSDRSVGRPRRAPSSHPAPRHHPALDARNRGRIRARLHPLPGAYLTPDLLGGGKSVMLGNLVQNQFTTARDWPFGSAASLILMLASAILLILPDAQPKRQGT